MSSAARMGVIVALAANALLLALKVAVSGWSDSLTLFSETINSLADVLGATVMVVFVTWAYRSRDEDHPFGHGRAEPIAGLVLAIFTAILGFEVLRHSLFALFEGTMPTHLGWLPMIAMIVTATVKTSLAYYFAHLGQSLNSPAFRASAVDCRNDVLVASQALLGLLLAELQWGMFDRISALLVGLYILYMAYQVASENINFLMGKAPNHELMTDIRNAARLHPGVRDVDDVRAHHVGPQVHVELTARVDPNLSTVQSHAIAEEVRENVESIGSVDRAFIHIEPHASHNLHEFISR